MGRRSKLRWDTPVGQTTGPGRFICHAKSLFTLTRTPNPTSSHSIQSVSWPSGEPQHHIWCLAQFLPLADSFWR